MTHCWQSYDAFLFLTNKSKGSPEDKYSHGKILKVLKKDYLKGKIQFRK